jgi:hypothetical protein
MGEGKLKKLLPVVAAIAFFVSLSLAYFSPVLEGKQIVQGDKKQWQGMAQEILEHRAAYDEDPLWSGSAFGGMPAYQIAVSWPTNLLLHVDKAIRLELPRPASFLLLYLLGMYFLLLCLRVDPWVSIVGAVAFALTTYSIIILEAGHNSKANAIGYMPAALGALVLLYRGKELLGAALFALFLGLQIAMNHLQVTYYLGFVLLFYALALLVEAWRQGALAAFMRRSVWGAVALAFALAANTGVLWGTMEYGKYTTRGASELTVRADGNSAEEVRTDGLDRDYITDWSYGIEESLTFLVPDAKGGVSGYIGQENGVLAGADTRMRKDLAQMMRYWGEQRFVSGPIYLGVVAVLLMLLAMTGGQKHARWWALAALPLMIVMHGVQAPILSGALLLAYFIAGLFLCRDTIRYALFAGSVLAVLLGWGKNLMPLTDFFLDHVPGYTKFRTVTIILVVLGMAVPALGAVYLDRLLRKEEEDGASGRRTYLVIGSLLLVLAVLALAPGSFTQLLSFQEKEGFARQVEEMPQMAGQMELFVEELQGVRARILSADAWRGFAFVLITGIVLVLFRRGIIGRPAVLAGVGLLVLIDLWVVDKRYVNNEKDRGRYLQWEEEASALYPHLPTPADEAILEQESRAVPAFTEKVQLAEQRLKGELSGHERRPLPERAKAVANFSVLRANTHYRVLNLNNAFNDARTSYFHRSVGGYHGAKLKRYQELIEFHLAPEISAMTGLMRSGTDQPALAALLGQQPALNMLDTRYLIYDPNKPPIRNPHALGAAWFVNEVKWVPNADAEVIALRDMDPRHTAVVDQRYRAVLGEEPVQVDSSAYVRVIEQRSNKIAYTLMSRKGGVVVFSEIHYAPDWQAYVDGEAVDHACANYVLRALRIPGGEHTVEFRVQSRPYEASSGIMLVTSLLILAGVAFAAFNEWRKARVV